MSARILITIQDTLGFWREELGTWTYDPKGHAPTNTYAAKVPDAWLSPDGTLSAEGEKRICAMLYGEHWQHGNDDGSKYFVLSFASRRTILEERALWAKQRELTVFEADGRWRTVSVAEFEGD